MKRIFSGIKKNYKTINIVIISICIYLLIVFPIISTIMESISPALTKCPYLQLTGKPCPLCGGTRFIKNIKNVFYDIHYVFNIFGLIILILILETIFRIGNIIKKENKEGIIKFDFFIHIILFIIYIIYSIYFINN